MSETERADDYMELCPICKSTFGDYFNVGRDHFAYCEEHKLCWNFASNQISYLQGQTKEQWEAIANKFILEGYKIVKGFHWPNINGVQDLQEWADKVKEPDYEVKTKYPFAMGCAFDEILHSVSNKQEGLPSERSRNNAKSPFDNGV